MPDQSNFLSFFNRWLSCLPHLFTSAGKGPVFWSFGKNPQH